MKNDEYKNKSELLYELRLLRLENLRLSEQATVNTEESSDLRQLTYLEKTALIDSAIRQSTDLSEMMNAIMDVLRVIFECHQAWLLHPCDPDSTNWRVPFRSVHPDFPIHFGPLDDLPVTPDLVENCRLVLGSSDPLPLGQQSSVKDVPAEAEDVEARSALLIALHPKVGRPWMMGLHHCGEHRRWTAEEKRLFQDISGRISDALSATLFNRNLQQNQARLKHLSAQLFRAQEEERKRVAEEIHDELGQAALAITIGLENAIFLAGDDAPDAMKRSLQSASNLSKGMVDKMRRMQTSLYPPSLRDFGAIPALNGFLDDFTNIYSEMTVRRGIHVTEDAIPDILRVPAFRIAQEALYNAAKHSKANTVTVSIDRIGNRLLLEVIDDGIGFDPSTTIRYPDKRLGLGLTSMRERAEMSDGRFQIESEPSRGTAIRVLWFITN